MCLDLQINIILKPMQQTDRKRLARVPGLRDTDNVTADYRFFNFS